MRIAILILFSSYAWADLVIYPAQGQSIEQQQQDEAECYKWAVQRSGYDPAQPPAAVTVQTPGVTGSGARVRGALTGALVSEIADGDAGDAALAGAVIGASRERRRQRRAAAEVETQAAQAQQQGLANFNRARSACLEGRGYTVK